MKKEFYNIANLVTKNAKVLDVGCGNGELMKYINENISKDIRGIELSKSNVQKCVEKGTLLDVSGALFGLHFGTKRHVFSERFSSIDFERAFYMFRQFFELLTPQKTLYFPCKIKGFVKS